MKVKNIFIVDFAVDWGMGGDISVKAKLFELNHESYMIEYHYNGHHNLEEIETELATKLKLQKI